MTVARPMQLARVPGGPGKGHVVVSEPGTRQRRLLGQLLSHLEEGGRGIT